MEPSYKQKMISNMAFVRHLEFENFWFFCRVSIAWDKICVCVLSFVKFGHFAAEMWRYNDFQNGGRPPCWILEIWHFHHLAVVRVRSSLLIPNFVSIGPRSRVIAKKMIVNMASARHLEFGNSWIFSHFFTVALVKICVRVPNFVVFGRFSAEIWSYNDFQNGGRPPSWIFVMSHCGHVTCVSIWFCFLASNFWFCG